MRYRELRAETDRIAYFILFNRSARIRADRTVAEAEATVRTKIALAKKAARVCSEMLSTVFLELRIRSHRESQSISDDLVLSEEAEKAVQACRDWLRENTVH